MKIFIMTPFSRDANSFWRCMGPLSYLAKQSEGEIEIYTPPPNTPIHWDTLDSYDLLFLHRPCRPDDLTMLRIARNLNIPTWVDYDDWLFHLPDWNSHTSTYHNPGIQNIMATMIASADIVTCSTQALAKEFLELNKNTVLVPNAYRSDLFYFRKSVVPERKEIFAWRGTNTHEGDLHSVLDGFQKLTEKVHFLGSPSYSLLSQMDKERYQRTDHVDVILYWKSIYELAPKVLLFPLKDCFFNRCKSNIAWIESIHAGALCVAPDMPEWRHPGCLNYTADDPKSFAEVADYAIRMDKETYQSQVSVAYEYIRSKFDISVVNEIRKSILRTVLSPGFERNTRDPYNQLTGIWALSVLKKEPLPRIGD